jgi:Mor family transcriptional regulator
MDDFNRDKDDSLEYTNINSLLDSITPDMIPPQYRRHVEFMGIKKFYELLEKEGRREVYFPNSADFIVKYVIRPKLIEEYKTGQYTQQALADKYQLSLKTVGTYIREAGTKKPI